MKKSDILALSVPVLMGYFGLVYLFGFKIASIYPIAGTLIFASVFAAIKLANKTS